MFSKTCILALSKKTSKSHSCHSDKDWNISSKKHGKGGCRWGSLKKNHMPQAWLQMKLRHLRQGCQFSDPAAKVETPCCETLPPWLKDFCTKAKCSFVKTLTKTMCFLCWWKYISWTTLGVIIKGTFVANSHSATPWSYGNKLQVFHPSHSVWRNFITLHIHIIRILMHTCKQNTMRKAMP